MTPEQQEAADLKKTQTDIDTDLDFHIRKAEEYSAAVTVSNFEQQISTEHLLSNIIK
jgi:hypothetical protein